MAEPRTWTLTPFSAYVGGAMIEAKGPGLSWSDPEPNVEVIELDPVLDLLEGAHKALNYADPGLVLEDQIGDLLTAHGRLGGEST